MPRATLTIKADDPTEITASEAWFMQWASSITRKSGNYGCGCCVNIYDIEASQGAIDSIPEALRAQSQWVEKGHGFGGKHDNAV